MEKGTERSWDFCRWPEERGADIGGGECVAGCNKEAGLTSCWTALPRFSCQETVVGSISCRAADDNSSKLVLRTFIIHNPEMLVCSIALACDNPTCHKLFLSIPTVRLHPARPDLHCCVTLTPCVCPLGQCHHTAKLWTGLPAAAVNLNFTRNNPVITTPFFLKTTVVEHNFLHCVSTIQYKEFYFRVCITNQMAGHQALLSPHHPAKSVVYLKMGFFMHQ